MQISFIQVPYQTMVETFSDILLREGVFPTKATTLAEVFATNSLEGVYTHGVNRFSRFIHYIRDGYVEPDHEPSLASSFGAIEQWNGNLAPGISNAIFATDRACLIAETQGIGCVALSNTNHWMRGGYYGWQAARKGFVFIGWTNTLGNMPAWGALDNRLGNNPLVIAVPHNQDAIVLDMAMAQYSYGALDLYQSKYEPLPVPGGYTTTGELTNDASEILASRRVLPIGYWKGAGLSLLLDILATILSAGLSTAAITKLPAEHAMSQVFLALDVRKLSNFATIQQALDTIIKDYQASESIDGKRVRYPGERIHQTRQHNLEHGIPVSQSVWNEIVSLQ